MNLSTENIEQLKKDIADRGSLLPLFISSYCCDERIELTIDLCNEVLRLRRELDAKEQEIENSKRLRVY